jgi:hypothetical protein
MSVGLDQAIEFLGAHMSPLLPTDQQDLTITWFFWWWFLICTMRVGLINSQMSLNSSILLWSNEVVLTSLPVVSKLVSRHLDSESRNMPY